MLKALTHMIYVPGALGADMVVRFKAPCDLQLIHVSGSISNSGSTLITIGNSDTAAAYLASIIVGISNTPTEFDRDDFVGGEFPHIAKGTIIAIAVDYDGNAGTAGQNLTLVLTFTEG
jgi:hypothetical protein